jgi:drug/metabolite transporter (DMT)-like permease
LVLVSTLTWATYSLASIGAVARNGAVCVTAFAMTVGAVVCTLAALFSGFTLRAPSGSEIATVLFLGVLCSGIAFSLWFRAIELFGPARIGALIYFQPFVTLVAGALVLHEAVTPYALAGGPLVILGVRLVNRGSARSDHRSSGEPSSNAASAGSPAQSET